MDACCYATNNRWISKSCSTPERRTSSRLAPTNRRFAHTPTSSKFNEMKARSVRNLISHQAWCKPSSSWRNIKSNYQDSSTLWTRSSKSRFLQPRITGLLRCWPLTLKNISELVNELKTTFSRMLAIKALPITPTTFEKREVHSLMHQFQCQIWAIWWTQTATPRTWAAIEDTESQASTTRYISNSTNSSPARKPAKSSSTANRTRSRIPHTINHPQLQLPSLHQSHQHRNLASLGSRWA